VTSTGIRLAWQPWSSRDNILLAALVGFAALLRLMFYTGFSGSDEMIYVRAAISILSGEWRSDQYIGALRYGINLPIAGLLWLFGKHEAVAAIWAFGCSLAEVALVYVMGRGLLNHRVGFFGALLLASLPLHVNLAGRLLADSPLAFFMTLSFALFLLAEARDRAGIYFMSGVAAGFVYWVKEATIIYMVLFLPLAWLCGPWRNRRLWLAAGALAMLFANCLLMWVVNGDPLHVFKVLNTTVNDVYLIQKGFRTEPGYYFGYLFAKLQHTGLLAYLAFSGCLIWFRKGRGIEQGHTAMVCILTWCCGMLLLFSFYAISLNPLTLIAKQSNYLVMFTAPLALLGGYFFSKLKGALLAAMLVVSVASGVLLSGMEQAAAWAPTANGRAAASFAELHPESVVYGSVNAVKASVFNSHFDREGKIPKVVPLIGLDWSHVSSHPAYAVWDEKDEDWSRWSLHRPSDPPLCWEYLGVLSPPESRPGGWLARFAGVVAGSMPQPLSARMTSSLATLEVPSVARVYRIPRNCRFNLVSGH